MYEPDARLARDNWAVVNTEFWGARRRSVGRDSVEPAREDSRPTKDGGAPRK